MGDARTGQVLAGARVITMDPRRPFAEAVGVASGEIVAVGDRGEVEAALDGATVVELGGEALLPGFIDAHHHYCLAAFDRGTPDLRLPAGSGIQDLLELVERLDRARPGSEWIRAQGYDQAKLREKRPPSADELDEVTGDRPVLLIHFSFHGGCLNHPALAELGWGDGSPDPPNGILVRGRRGRLTGEVVEGAFFRAEARSRDSLLERTEDAWAAECERHGHDLLAAGITRVGDAAVPPSLERLYERAAADDRLPVTVHRMPVGSASLIEPRLGREPTGAGPSASPVGPAKLFMDGAERCAVCLSMRQAVGVVPGILRAAGGGERLAAARAAARTARSNPLRRGPDGLLHGGMLFWEQGALDSTVASAFEHGFQVAQHAIGNEAIETALTALERAGPLVDAAPGRPRLEHAMILDEALAGRIASAGAVAVVQPHFIREVSDDVRLTQPLPGLGFVPLRTLRHAGVELAGSSDYPVSSFDVLSSIRAAATRETPTGHLLEPDESLAVEDALRAYTLGSAGALGVEREAGSIEVGKRADLVALSEDPLALDPSRLDRVRVTRTIVGGATAYEQAT